MHLLSMSALLWSVRRSVPRADRHNWATEHRTAVTAPLATTAFRRWPVCVQQLVASEVVRWRKRRRGLRGELSRRRDNLSPHRELCLLLRDPVCAKLAILCGI